MPLFLPTRNALVDKTLMATTSMWAWMRDITAAFNGGNGFAPADATYFLRTADTSLPNARVATNSATITLDYSTPGQVKWNALSTSPVIEGATVTLTNAQIKALPTTPVEIIAAPGATTRISWFILDLQSDFTAGAYTNVNATSGWIAAQRSVSLQDVSNYIGNDSTIVLTNLTTFLGANARNVLLEPYTVAEPVAFWGNLPVLRAGTDANNGIQLHADNNGSGDFTGGNAANTLRVTPYWIETATA